MYKLIKKKFFNKIIVRVLNSMHLHSLNTIFQSIIKLVWIILTILTSTSLFSRSVITAVSDFIFDFQSDIVCNIIENILPLKWIFKKN